MDTPLEPPCSSSIEKELLLQGLILENSFANLHATSLLPFLDQIDSGETLQDFLDIANACVAAAAKSGSPIRNPKGFLFAQLKAGYINPPEGYKSRKVLAQETRNRQSFHSSPDGFPASRRTSCVPENERIPLANPA